MEETIGEHRRGMNYRCSELTLTSLLTLSCALSLGCDAPEKTVGQETDGGTESGTGSGSDTNNCGGVLPCGTSETDSDTGSTGSTGSTGGETESDSGVPGNCNAIDTPAECAAENCAWQDISVVASEGASCQITEEASGYCFDPGTGETGEGCFTASCMSDNLEYWVRELAEGTSEVIGGNCFLPVPEGFIRCEFGDDDPAACDCACSGTEASLPDGFEATLGASGCADMTVYGASPDGSIGLALSTGFSPVADAVAAGETLTTTHDVSEFARLSVYVGTNVTYLECNDAIDRNAFEIQQEWVATAGTVEIEVIPEPGAMKFDTQGFATVSITGLEVSFGGVTEALDTVLFEDVAVGWLPG